MKKNKLLLLLYLLIFTLVLNGKKYSFENFEQLVITEVHIDSLNEVVWLEITNPTDSELTLNSIRISGVRTPNILPPSISKENKNHLLPNERIIVCSNNSKFRENYGDDIRCIEVKILKYILEGGFIAINHMSGIENPKNIVRIGEEKKSKLVEKKVEGSKVLQVSKGIVTYNRTILNNGQLSEWKKNEPTPGK